MDYGNAETFKSFDRIMWSNSGDYTSNMVAHAKEVDLRFMSINAKLAGIGRHLHRMAGRNQIFGGNSAISDFR